ncbi:MAG TPA: zinc-ribbon domain-containing protein [Thermodesulfovibrionales bacterium]|nr:zinc-ribbon domain-containing protein [Thermodesulfovibrionales bacterium]
MNMVCKKCKSPYYFDDSKIPDEGLQFKCPRCGNIVIFKKDAAVMQVSGANHGAEEFGANPLLYGSYAGALGGLGCAIPVLMMTLLGLGFMSLGMQVSGYTAAAALVLVLLKTLSLGIFIGMALAFIGAKTGIDVWSIKGGLIGALIGVLIGLISGAFIGTFMGGILGVAIIFGSMISWLIKATLASIVVILVRKYVFSVQDGELSASLSGKQMAFVGLLFFLMVFTVGMDVKGLFLAKSTYSESTKQMSSEGLIVKAHDKSSNSDGDLVISGTVVNTTDKDKTGWIVIAELLDDSGIAFRKATLVNGIQAHTVSDLETLKNRGQSIHRPDPSEAANKMIIKPGDSVPFEIVFVDPPKEFKEYNLKLKNLDQDSIRELLSETLKDINSIKK